MRVQQGRGQKTNPRAPRRMFYSGSCLLLETKAFVQASLTVLGRLFLGMASLPVALRLPAALATWESGISIALIIFITVGPHLWGQGHHFSLTPAIALASGLSDYVPFCQLRS